MFFSPLPLLPSHQLYQMLPSSPPPSESRYRAIILLLALLPAVALWCQDLYVDGSSRYAEWGSYNKETTDAFVMLANKAALARIPVASLALAGERAYGLSEIARYRLAMALPVSNSVFGIQGGYAMAGSFRESLVAINYARKLAKPVDIGIQLGYQQSGVAGYPQLAQVSAEAGLMLHPAPMINAGWNIRLPRRLDAGAGAASLPFLYSMGIGFDPAGSWSAAIAIEKRPSAGVTGGVGCIYRPVPRIECRLGIRTGSTPLWFGCGIRFAGFRLDVSATVHERLGFTPAIAIHRNMARPT